MALCQQLDRASRPDAPMPQQAADDPPAQGIRREQVEHDVIIVAGVERDVAAPDSATARMTSSV